MKAFVAEDPKRPGWYAYVSNRTYPSGKHVMVWMENIHTCTWFKTEAEAGQWGLAIPIVVG